MNTIKSMLKKSLNMTWFLIKVTVPISLVIKIVSDLGLIHLVANFFSPLMKVVGLSGELGIVWITGMLTNIYGALITLFNFSQYNDFNTREITILATMILIAHSMFPETQILVKSKGNGLKIVFLRIGSAMILGFLLNVIYSYFNLYQDKAIFSFIPKATKENYFDFFINQGKNYIKVFLLILVLLCVMEVLQKIGLIGLINKLLKPILRPLGISEEAISINLVSLTLGITYGAALFVDEIAKGNIKNRELNNSLYLMSLCHAFIEDTLLMISIGAKISGVLVSRIVFTYIVIYSYNKFREIYPKSYIKITE